MLGMVFASRGFLPGTSSYTLMTFLTGLLIVASCAVFLVLLAFEAARSTKVCETCSYAIMQIMHAFRFALQHFAGLPPPPLAHIC